MAKNDDDDDDDLQKWRQFCMYNPIFCGYDVKIRCRREVADCFQPMRTEIVVTVYNNNITLLLQLGGLHLDKCHSLWLLKEKRLASLGQLWSTYADKDVQVKTLFMSFEPCVSQVHDEIIFSWHRW